MSRFVRSSKYRHVFGTPGKPELCYNEIKVTRSAWDSNKVKVNTKYLGVCWEAGGGGSFVVIPLDKPGKLSANYPLISGHKGPVLDIDFHPFNSSLVASVSEDASVKIWKIPEGGLKETLVDPVQNLIGHRRKVGTADFHPTANNILATTGTDFLVKLWDIEAGQEKVNIEGHGDIIHSLTWNWDGSLAGTACKDKRARLFDPRTNKIATEWEAHAGVKGMRGTFLGSSGQFFTIGFSKTSDRQYALWDPKNTSQPLVQTNIDTASGLIMPFYDADTGVLYLAGKGDGNIRYYEYTGEGEQLYFLSEFKSNTPQRGMGILPKRANDIAACEITRLLKVTGNSVEPISFQVPRKSEVFQDDIFPDTISGEPSLSANEYFSGKNAQPKLVSLSVGFVPKEIVSDFKPVVQQTESGPQTEKELRAEYEKQKTRISYLEAELAKKDARIKQLEGGN